MGADIIVFGMISGDFLFDIDNGILCVLRRIASLRKHTIYVSVKKLKDIAILPPGLAL